jgi:hypothetical protein
MEVRPPAEGCSFQNLEKEHDLFCYLVANSKVIDFDMIAQQGMVLQVLASNATLSDVKSFTAEVKANGIAGQIGHLKASTDTYLAIQKALKEAEQTAGCFLKLAMMMGDPTNDNKVTIIFIPA